MQTKSELYVKHTMDIIFLVLLLSLATVFLNLLLRRNADKRLPPGPVGLPFLGRLPFLGPDLHTEFAELARCYGPILSFRLGTKLCVVITSPSAATEIFKHQDAIFANRDANTVARILTGCIDIVWSSNGPNWRMVRKVAVRELLSTSALDSLCSLRRKQVHRVLREIQAASGEPVHIGDIAHSVSLNISLGMIIQEATDEGKFSSEMKKELLEFVKDFVEILGAPNISDFLTVLAPLDLQGLQRRMKRLRLGFDNVFEYMISLKVRSGCTEGGVKDFLQLMLDIVDKKDPEMPLELDHVKVLIMDMVSAAVDTTSTNIEWAMTELMRNPETLVKAQEELDAVVGKERLLEESHFSSLPFLNAVLKETLRLHPPVPLLVPRTPSETCDVGGYCVPKGTTVFVNAWAIQRDPSWWEEPLEFRPERFLGSENRWDYFGKSFEYMPFGGGRRTCPGIYMGENIMMYLLGSLLHMFNWRLPPGTVRVHAEEKFGIVLKRKEPLLLVPDMKMSL